MRAVACGALLLPIVVASVGTPFARRGPHAIDLRGAWTTERYLLKDGAGYSVRGQILFTERNWSVIYFVVGPDGKLARGSAEGGTYTLTGKDLIFSHGYRMTDQAPAMPGLAAQVAGLQATEPSKRAKEPATVELDGNHLTLHFGPSGNRMTFVRSVGE